MKSCTFTVTATDSSGGAGTQNQSTGSAFGFVEKFFHEIPPYNILIPAVCRKREKPDTLCRLLYTGYSHLIFIRPLRTALSKTAPVWHAFSFPENSSSKEYTQ